MNKSAYLLFLLILSMSPLAFGSAVPSQSTFKENFSLNAIVEANQEYLLEEARLSSGSETGSSEGFNQSHEEMIVRIDPVNAPVFMEALRSDIEQALVDGDPRVVGSEQNGSAHFSFSYYENSLHGTVHVWGVTGEQAEYTIIVLITENFIE